MSTLPIPAQDELPEFARLSLLAIVQGLTEFLPISSSGHLVLAQEAMGGAGELPLAVDVALHVGTLVAVLIVYRRDVLAVLRGLLSGRVTEPLAIAVGTLPVVVVALLFGDRVEEAFSDARFAAIGLCLTASVLVAGEVGRRRAAASAPPPALDGAPPITWRIALLVGVAQAFALMPGVSRSGSTIAAGLLLGLRPERAARFSFLLSILAISGAAVLKLPDLFDGSAELPSTPVLLWAMLLAALVGWAALRALLAFLDRGAFVWFAAYCLALGGGFLLFA